MPDIEEHLRRAFEEGKFDNLPGKGKPLNLKDDTHVDPEWRMAYHMLAESGYALSWIHIRREIAISLEKALSELSRTWNWRRERIEIGKADHSVEAEWHRAQEDFCTKISEINRQITHYNLEAPLAQLHLKKINARQEIDRLG